MNPFSIRNAASPLLLMTFLLTPLAAQFPWGQLRNVSNDAAPSSNQTVTLDGARIYVAWHNGTTNSIQFSRSEDRGLTFSTPITVPATTGSNEPGLTTAMGRLYMVLNEGTGVSSRVRIATSNDGGRTWSAPRVISDPVDDVSTFNPRIAIDTATGKLAVSYSAVTRQDPRSEFKATASVNGTVWTPPINFTNSPNVHSRRGAMGIARGRLVMAHVEEATPAAVYLYVFDDSAGFRYLVANLVNPAINTGLSVNVCHYATDVVYTDLRPPNTQGEVYLRRVVNGTGALSPETNMTNTPNVAERFAKVWSIGGTTIVLYEDTARTSDNLVYRISFDDLSFGAPVPVPGSTRGGNSSVVARDNVNVLAHSDGNSPNDVLVRRGSVPATIDLFGKGCSTRGPDARPYLEGFGPNLNLRLGPVGANSLNVLLLSAARLPTPIQFLGCSIYLDPTLMIPPILLVADQTGVARLDLNAPLPNPVIAYLQSVQPLTTGISTSKPGVLEIYNANTR